jgi:hypothetical protein
MASQRRFHGSPSRLWVHSSEVSVFTPTHGCLLIQSFQTLLTQPNLQLSKSTVTGFRSSPVRTILNHPLTYVQFQVFASTVMCIRLPWADVDCCIRPSFNLRSPEALSDPHLFTIRIRIYEHYLLPVFTTINQKRSRRLLQRRECCEKTNKRTP